MSVVALRDLAREAMLSSGARGFMRFILEGDALLVTDAAVRCDDGGTAMQEALFAAGFTCKKDGRLIQITPTNALLERLCAGEGRVVVDWNSSLYPAQSLAVRLMREAYTPLEDSGKRLVLLTARQLWRPRDKALEGLAEVRAAAAVCLRKGNRNGFYQTGMLLCNWCHEQMKGEDAR